MITAKLIRDAMDALHPTYGRLFADDLVLYTTEDPWLNNKKDVSCIPCGTYRLTRDFSNRFKKVMPLVLNVQNRTGIRIHGGVDAEDTEGCPLVGRERAVNGDLLDTLAASHDFNNWLRDALEEDKVQLIVSVAGAA